MDEELKKLIKEALAAFDFGGGDLKVGLEYPSDLARGDYASNVALVLAKQSGENPLALAEKIVKELEARQPAWLASVAVAGPGFINFTLAPQFFSDRLREILAAGEAYGRGRELVGQRVIIEYTDPNPFKEFHIGHLMSNAIGEALSRLIESQGATLARACYQGDVGLHVAKALWGLLKLKPATLDAATLGRAYALGATEGDENEVRELNRQIYERSDATLNDLYDRGRKASLEYFAALYQKLGTKFDFYFFESATGEFGKQLVAERAGEVFEVSDGAVIFPGEKYGLHTRVFINSEGLPTYEAKELGLAKIKHDAYPYDSSIVISGNEINAYFQVLLKALELVFPDLAAKTRHVSHGMLRLPTGKMSSRTGDVVTAESLLTEVERRIGAKIGAERELAASDIEAIAVAAVKYSILRQRPGKDIIFDLEQSLSLEGDSGPYLQYACVRARSVLQKTEVAPAVPETGAELNAVIRLLPRFPEVVRRAAAELAPQQVVAYLTELAAAWNAYYAGNQIIGSAEEPARLALAQAVVQTLASGLDLLGIRVPEKM